MFLFKKNSALTKYVVGAKAKPPKNPRRPPKKGKVIPTNIVNAATEKINKNKNEKGKKKLKKMITYQRKNSWKQISTTRWV